jgi:hypothetical protein
MPTAQMTVCKEHQRDPIPRVSLVLTDPSLTLEPIVLIVHQEDMALQLDRHERIIALPAPAENTAQIQGNHHLPAASNVQFLQAYIVWKDHHQWLWTQDSGQMDTGYLSAFHLKRVRVEQ